MLKKSLILLALLILLIPKLALAQATLLPGQEVTENFCRSAFLETGDGENARMDNPYYFKNEANTVQREQFLSCAIKLGRVHLWMLPYFITYIANFFIYIAGTVAVLFVLLGGFWYMVGGISDDKEKGKKTITYALIGLSITLLAWIMVNILMVQVTG